MGYSLESAEIVMMIPIVIAEEPNPRLNLGAAGEECELRPGQIEDGK